MTLQKMGMVEIGTWKRWGLEKADGGAWKMDGGAWEMETVEPGKWDRWSLETGDGGALKMGTVELGFEALWAL